MLKIPKTGADELHTGGRDMLHKTCTTLLFLASCCVVAYGCGQTTIGSEQSSSTKVDLGTTGIKDPESEKASQPQSVAGAYLTCVEYTKLPTGSPDQYAVGCRVMSSEKKKMPMRSFPAHEWRVTDNEGRIIPAQPSYPADDPDADAVLAIEKSKTQNGAKVQFMFDKNVQSASVSYTIGLKTPVSNAQLDLWRANFGGKWHVTQDNQRKPFGEITVEFAEGTAQALIRAATELPGSRWFAGPTAADTVIARGTLQQDAAGLFSNLLLEFEKAANVTVTPDSFKNKQLKFTVRKDGNPVLTDGLVTWVFCRK